MQLSTSHSTKSFCYTMCRVPQQVFDELNYLGILLDNKLSWPPRINSLCRKANLLLAYKQIVLPSVEYCCSIWDPCQRTSIHKLEMIQHHIACFVLNRRWRRNCRDSVPDMLARMAPLIWQTLEECRKQSRLTLLFKFTNGLYVPDQHLPALSPVTSTMANHPLKLLHIYARTN